MISRSMIIYAFVSTLCFFLNNMVLIAMDWLGASLPAAIGISFAVVVVVGYVLHGWGSFRTKLSVAGFGRYAIAMSANVPLAFVALWGWRDMAGLRIEFSAPLATGCMILVNFVICRFVIFGGRRTSTEVSLGKSQAESAILP